MLAKPTDVLSNTNNLPSTATKLVYLDQSFLSAICFPEEQRADRPILERLYAKLQWLKARNKIILVVSDIHCHETSAFPKQYADKMKKLWPFQNSLATGTIAANWADIFVVQHRRILAGQGLEYPASDIGLRDRIQMKPGINIIMTNSWQLRIHLANTTTSDDLDKKYREIIDRQATRISRCDGVEDCLNYIHHLWRADIQAGIATWRQRRDFELSFKRLGASPDAESLASLKLPNLHATPFLGVIRNVIHGLDEEVMLRRWSDLLEQDPIGPCPSLRIRTALEAQLLCDWCDGKRRNPKKFRANLGWSRQNDIDHVSAFVPYVDAITTDRDMHNLCNSQVVNDEIKRFSCRMFSVKNYDEFEEWLDKLLAEVTMDRSDHGTKAASASRRQDLRMDRVGEPM